jgi:hypothetical protein
MRLTEILGLRNRFARFPQLSEIIPPPDVSLSRTFSVFFNPVSKLASQCFPGTARFTDLISTACTGTSLCPA